MSAIMDRMWFGKKGLIGGMGGGNGSDSDQSGNGGGSSAAADHNAARHGTTLIGQNKKRKVMGITRS